MNIKKFHWSPVSEKALQVYHILSLSLLSYPEGPQPSGQDLIPKLEMDRIVEYITGEHKSALLPGTIYNLKLFYPACHGRYIIWLFEKHLLMQLHVDM